MSDVYGSGSDNWSSSASARLKGLIVSKPIVYGNNSRYFGKKREEDGHTHHWCVYLRPYLCEDMSTYVKKVHFGLHASFAEPERIITKPPYEVHETGWGEFDLTIKIFFVDPQEKPVVLSHLLKLFQSDSNIMIGKKDLVREFYDELVFVDPSPSFHRALTVSRPLAGFSSPRSQQQWDKQHEEDYHMKAKSSLGMILELRQKTMHAIWALKEQLKLKGEAIQQARQTLDDLGEMPL